MFYKAEVVYLVEISLVDKSVDKFHMRGQPLDKFKEKVWVSGYVRTDKADTRISYWISPYVISQIKVTEKAKA
jgi:hypothetical protein